MGEKEIAAVLSFYGKLKDCCEENTGDPADCRKCKMMRFCDTAPKSLTEQEIRHAVDLLESDK